MNQFDVYSSMSPCGLISNFNGFHAGRESGHIIDLQQGSFRRGMQFGNNTRTKLVGHDQMVP